MKLQFDTNQDYQIEAIRAVVALFEGQPDASQSAVTRHFRNFEEVRFRVVSSLAELVS